MTKPKSKQDKAAQTPVKPDPSTDSDKAAMLSEHIGRELRSMFDGVVAEPVPDRSANFSMRLRKSSQRIEITIFLTVREQGTTCLSSLFS
jgi:hypothetical protein